MQFTTKKSTRGVFSIKSELESHDMNRPRDQLRRNTESMMANETDQSTIANS